ncbi:MAG: hypothetical protein ACC661_05570, partial [Verrucomicrobiales bacterium]
MKASGNHSHDSDSLEKLFDKALEHRLDAQELARLEEMVLGDATVRRRYADYAQLHATLASESASLPRSLEELEGRKTSPRLAISWIPLAAAAAHGGPGLPARPPTRVGRGNR